MGSHDFIIENLAYKDSFLNRIDPRIKIIISALLLLTVLILEKIWYNIGVFIIIITVLSVGRVPFKPVIIRSIFPLAMALIVLITQALFNGQEVYTILIGGNFKFTLYMDGLVSGLIIFTRVLSGVSVLIFLTITTPLPKLVAGARWFGVPRTLLEITLLTYRYIFVLMEEIKRIKEAQKIRLGYSAWALSVKSVAGLIGMIIIRVFNRAENMYQAMISRGYNGTLVIEKLPPLKLEEFWPALYISVFILLIGGISFVN